MLGRSTKALVLLIQIGAYLMIFGFLPPARAEGGVGEAPPVRPDCSMVVDRSARPEDASRFTTIQNAVDLAVPGEVICVRSTNHENERVVVTNSGSAAAPIHIHALHGTRTAGFVVKADHVTIEGFFVSNRGQGDQDGSGMGIYLAGVGLRVFNNTVVNTERDGIGCESFPPACEDVFIIHNTVQGADGAGIIVSGARILVERNDISGSIMNNSSDADGIRFFGAEIVISGNVIHNISSQGYTEGQEPHTDCFQTFDDSKPPTTDVVIKGNSCHNVDHQCLIASASTQGQSARISFRNNVCQSSGSQAVLVENIPFVTVTNNLFLPSTAFFGVVLRSGATDATIMNNVSVGEAEPYAADASSQPGLTAAFNLRVPDP